MRFSRASFSLLVALVGGVNGFGFLLEKVAAQAVEVDAGAFIVELGGRAVGTETFRIRRTGFGDNARTFAQGTLELVEDGETLNIQSILSTLGVGMALERYLVKVSTPSEIEIRLERRGARMVSVTSSEAGVQEREYREALPQRPTVLLDRFFAHQYFFVAPYQTPGGITLSAILPRPGGQPTGTLRMTTVEPVTVGGVTIQAQRLELRLDGIVHDIWLDGQNRVLRVQIPSLDYVATRRDPPPSL